MLILKKIANLGVKPSDDIELTKAIRLLNIFTLFAFACTITVLVFTLYFQLNYMAILFSLSLSIGMVLTILLNYMRHFNMARSLLMSVIYYGITGLTLLYGLKGHTQYFLIPAVATALLFFANSKNWQRWLVSSVIVPLWALLEIYFINNQPLITLEAAALNSLRIIADTLLFTLIVFLSFILSKENNRQINLISKQKEKLQSINKNLTQFTYIVSHDLKAPLKNIYSFIGVIQSSYGESFGEELKRLFYFVEVKTKQMDVLISDILDYARSSEKTENASLVNLNNIISEITHTLQIPRHIDLKIPSNLPEIVTGKTQITQVLSNLIGNAVKYSDKALGSIEVTYSDNKTHHCFEVKDNGPGIAKKHQENIFKVFETAHETDRNDSTGIGLAIVKKLVEINGGEIGVESTLGSGATFWFTWKKISKKNSVN